MAIGEHTSWLELCHAALEAKDPNELLKIVQELNKALKHEELVLRDFREATRANQVSGENPALTIIGENEAKRYFKPKERILRLLRNGKDGRVKNSGC
jgi:hypothetical protein